MYYFLMTMIYIIVFFMGAVVFSYLHLVIERLPKQENILVRYVACPHCGHELRAKDCFPVISRIRFGNKCRYCREPFAKRPMIFEIAGGVGAVASVIFYGVHLQAILWFLVVCDLAVITMIDADTQEIPPVLNWILLVLGIPAIWLFPQVDLMERLIGILCVSLPMLLLAIVLNGFGGGDVKLMAAAGFFLGWKATVIAFFIGAILGGGYGIYVLKTKKKGRKDCFAFGPCLCIGILVAMTCQFGQHIMQMYIDYLMSFMTT